MSLSKGIKSLLIKCLNESVVVASWGVTDIQIEDSQLSFKVNGLLYNGEIRINECNDKTYIVKMSNCEFSCNLDNIIYNLDEKIERTNNYTDDLINWIKNQ